jgi:hypothetical protein
MRHALYDDDTLKDGCKYPHQELISPILVLVATKAEMKLQKAQSTGWLTMRTMVFALRREKDSITCGFYQNLDQLTALGEKCETKRKHNVDLPIANVSQQPTETGFLSNYLLRKSHDMPSAYQQRSFFRAKRQYETSDRFLSWYHLLYS